MEADVSLLPTSASFEELVQDCFLVYRGTGVMLSPLDVALIGSWAEESVPFEVVARGIRRAAEAALFDAGQGIGGLRSLRGCRRQVESEIKKYLGQTTGRGKASAEVAPAPLHHRRHRKLCSVLKKMGRETPALFRGTEQLLARFAELPGDLAEAEAREETADVVLMRTLPFPERLALLREARQMAQATGVSRGAKAHSRRFHRSALLRRRLSLPAFW